MEQDTGTIDDVTPVKILIWQKNEVPRHILKKCDTLSHVLEDCGETALVLSEHSQARYLDILLYLVARNQASDASEKDQPLPEEFKILDAQTCAALLNSADFYAIPSLFATLAQQLAQKIMAIGKDELLASSKELAVNPAIEPLVTKHILEKNPDLRVAILKSYPIDCVTLFYDLDPKSFLYSFHNETMVSCNNSDKYIEIRQLPCGKLLHTIPVPAFHTVTAIQHSPDGQTVAIGLKCSHEKMNHIALHDSSTGTQLATFHTQHYNCYVRELLFSPNNEKITALFSNNPFVITWDISTSEIIDCTPSRAKSLIRYTPENVLVEVIINCPYIAIKNLKTKVLIKHFLLEVGMHGIKECRIYNTVIRTVNHDYKIELWNFSGKLIDTYDSQGDAHLLWHNTYSPTFISSSGTAIKLLDVRTGAQLHTLSVSKFTNPVCTPDGNTITSFFKNKLFIWDIKKINTTISNYITVPQLALLCALSKNVIGLNDIKQNLCLKTIADSLDFNSTKFYSRTSFKNRVKSLFN